jgi:hypothetical protein
MPAIEVSGRPQQMSKGSFMSSESVTALRRDLPHGSSSPFW